VHKFAFDFLYKKNHELMKFCELYVVLNTKKTSNRVAGTQLCSMLYV
jgi:hypothetical protein